MSDVATADDARQFMLMLGGKWVTAAIATAAKLGVADVLAEKKTGLEDLADVLDCHAPSLKRLMRVLCGEGLVEEDITGAFELTPLGEQMTSDRLGPVAVYVGEPSVWNPWSRLAGAIEDGGCAFEDEHGVGLFGYLEQHRDVAQIYHQGIDAYTKAQADALRAVFDFSERTSVLDIGGGRGSLLSELLKHEPHLRGTLLDLGPALENARSHFDAVEMESRVTLKEQSFFDPLPSGHDVYVLKHVLHNWSDEDAQRILARCREAMSSDSVLLVVEGFVLPGNRRDAVRLLDLEMMVLFGKGGERSKPEFRQLLHASGFRMEVTVDLAGTTRLLVCHPR